MKLTFAPRVLWRITDWDIYSSKSKLVSTDIHDDALEGSVPGVETIHFDIEGQLDEHFPRKRANTTTSEADTESARNFIVFGEESKIDKMYSGHHSALGEQSSAREPKGLFRRPGEDSSNRDRGDELKDSETADEEFSRPDTPRQEIAKATIVDVEIKEDAILYVS